MEISNPNGHIDSMLAKTRLHHMRLSQLADHKANMLLTMASLVLTLSASQLIRPHFFWSALVMIVFCLATVVLAAYAAMPKMPLSRQTKHLPDVDNPNFNLLFFGDFTQLAQEEFEVAMEEMMNDPNLVYRAQVRDIYAMGTFLRDRKFRFLRLAYLTFISGFFVGVLILGLTELLGKAFVV